MNLSRLLLCVLCLSLVAGCAPKTRYTWKGYDDKLYKHYKDPAQSDEFIQQLKEVIADGEEAGNVPPGIYAECGYALNEKGEFGDAIKYYRLESDKWPESRPLMAKMIANAERRGTNKVKGASK